MVMDLEVTWHKPLKLKDGAKDNLIFKVDDIDKWYGCSGLYMFCRRHGENIMPLYIGKADNIGKRINQQLNNTKLMKGIENALNGEKVLVIGEFISKGGQGTTKAISIIEKALIEHALGKGLDLINKQGTKTKVHKLSFSGYQAAKSFTGQAMNVKQK